MAIVKTFFLKAKLDLKFTNKLVIYEKPNNTVGIAAKSFSDTIFVSYITGLKSKIEN